MIRWLKQWRNRYVIRQVEGIEFPPFRGGDVVRQRVVFFGRVQNVGFRLEVCELARRLHLSGFVQNRDTHSVVAYMQGERERIAFVIRFMQSLKRISIKQVRITQLPIRDEDGFTIAQDAQT